MIFLEFMIKVVLPILIMILFTISIFMYVCGKIYVNIKWMRVNDIIFNELTEKNIIMERKEQAFILMEFLKPVIVSDWFQENLVVT